MENDLQDPPEKRIPRTEKEALNLGRNGHWAPIGTPPNLAKVQNASAIAAEEARNRASSTSYSNNVDWNNAITGSSAKAINLDLDDLRRQGVGNFNSNG